MNTGIFGEGFPYSNFHDLNMDWIIKIAKDFLDQYTHIQEIIEQGKDDIETLTESGITQIGDLTETSLQDLVDKKDALEALLQHWYDTHSEDIANQLADALADLNEWYTTHQNYLNDTLTQNITTFDNHADQKLQSVIEQIPAEYTELENVISDIQIPLTWVMGKYVRPDKDWQDSSSFGVAVVPVSGMSKFTFESDTVNPYLADVALSYGTNIGDPIAIAYNFDTANVVRTIDIPEGIRTAFITKPIDIYNVLGTTEIFGLVDGAKVSDLMNRSFIKCALTDETNNYVNGADQWTTNPLFGTFKPIMLNGATIAQVHIKTENPYIQTVVFTEDAIENDALIVSDEILTAGFHILNIPDGAKYMYITTGVDSNGVRRADPDVWISNDAVIENARYDYSVYPIPDKFLLDGTETADIYTDNIQTEKNDIRAGGVNNSSLLSNKIHLHMLNAGTEPLALRFYNKFNMIHEQEMLVQSINITKTNKAVCVIGDSTIAGVGSTPGKETECMLDEFELNNKTLTLIGTGGSGNNKYEGYSGRSITQFRASENNPFYNPTTQDFDFNYYLNNNDLQTPDCVVLQAGINDMFYSFDNRKTRTAIVMESLATIINNILSTNQSIKVFYNLIFPPIDDQTSFGNSYGLSPTRNLVDFTFKYWNTRILKELKQYISDNNRFFIIPTNLILESSDMYNSVHPNASGYEKLAKLVCRYIWAN